jgi:hypothetical protein
MNRAGPILLLTKPCRSLTREDSRPFALPVNARPAAAADAVGATARPAGGGLWTGGSGSPSVTRRISWQPLNAVIDTTATVPAIRRFLRIARATVLLSLALVQRQVADAPAGIPFGAVDLGAVG